MSIVLADRLRFPRRALLALTLTLGLVGCGALRSAGADGDPGPDEVHLVILHTNDVHGQVLPRPATWLDRDEPPPIGGLSRVAAHVRRVRREERAAGRPVLVVDAGDWFQGTPEGSVDGGRAFVRAQVAVGYDAMCLGNHEFDNGLTALKELLRDTRPPVIAANVIDPATRKVVAWTPPWRVVEKGGLRIALIGLVTPTTPDITHPDAATLHFADPVDIVREARLRLRGRVDLLLPVGHVDVEESQRLAAAFPDLPLVVSGHSHTYLAEGLRAGNTLIVQAGSKASGVGRVDLWFDRRTGATTRVTARIDDLLDEPLPQDGNAVVDRACRELVRASEERMGEIVGSLGAQVLRRPVVEGGRSTVAGNWITDFLRAHTGADVALHNRGGTRADLQAGEVTRRELFEVLPFENDVVTLTLSGRELFECVRLSEEGGGHTRLDYSGLTATVRDANGARELVRVEVGGRPLDPEAEYRVTANSFLARGGDAYRILTAGRERVADPLLLRDVAELSFRHGPTLAPPADERILLEPEAGP